jgi:hypothetical protein
MNASQPPRLATWLLKRLVSGPKRESLIGDLIERYQRRPSTTWYWRQALTAILWDVVGGIRDHKLLALRAILTGAGFMLAYLAVTWPLAYTLFVLQNGGVYVGRYWLTLPALIVKVLLVVNSFIGFTVSGWIVGRLHRDRLAPMLCAYVLSVVVFLLAEWVRFVGLRLDVALVFLVAIPVSILLGGLWGAHPERQLPVESA